MTLLFNNFFPPKVVTLVSQKPEDFSLKNDQTDLTKDQQELLSAQLGFSISKTVNIRQVHGNSIVFVPKEASYVVPQVLEDADGIVTDALNLPIVVRTADCVPVFVYDCVQEKIGLFHAGWKGTSQDILLKGLKLMGARPENVKIAFGPAIRACCYEVSEDFYQHFPDNIVQRDGKDYLDLVQVNKEQALRFGVREEDMDDSGVCTCCDEDYFSYRREGEKTGRMISLMILNE